MVPSNNIYILGPLQRLTSQMSKVKFIRGESTMSICICINTHLCMNENWEFLQQSLSEASEATVTQSRKRMTAEENSIGLSSERN